LPGHLEDRTAGGTSADGQADAGDRGDGGNGEPSAQPGTEDPQRRADLIAGHLQRLENELDRTRAAVRSLRRLLSPSAADLKVELRSVRARTCPGIRGETQRGDIAAWYDGAMRELDEAFPEADRTGPPGGRYANELFTEDAGEVIVFRPVRVPRALGRIEVLDSPAVELAVTVHGGAHDDIGVTYGRLGAWVTDHALAVDGPVHETYLVGPDDTPVPEECRTEIGWPVFPVAPA
jgi:effector-binding domain-containing protein